MRYDFIAELFVKKDDKEPRYKTHLWGIKDEKNFIKEIGMTSCCLMWSDGDDYMKEMDLWELTEYFSNVPNASEKVQSRRQRDIFAASADLMPSLTPSIDSTTLRLSA